MLSFYICRWFLRRSIANKRAFKVSGKSGSREWKGISPLPPSSYDPFPRQRSSHSQRPRPYFSGRGEGMRRCGYHHGCMGRGCHPHGVNACTSGKQCLVKCLPERVCQRAHLHLLHIKSFGPLQGERARKRMGQEGDYE